MPAGSLTEALCMTCLHGCMQAGEVGGFEAYLLADEDGDGSAAAEVYRQVRLSCYVCAWSGQ